MAKIAVAEKPPEEDDGKLDVAALVKMFEDSEEATQEARGLSERDRDYYDNIQYTAEEEAILKKRGQPATIDNRIKTKVDFLVGFEKSQRIDPKALPRTPQHEEEADGASQALRYVADSQEYDSKRSEVWRNLLVEGSGGISVAVETGYDGKPEIVLRRWAWDRMFADPHSSEPDYSDAGYLGGVIWMDYADALAQYADAKDILDTMMSGRSNLSETYDDRPKYRLWADTKRKRVRVCQIWLKRDKEWHFAEFTKGGILKAGPSPYKDDKGESDCEMIFQSAYVNRENDRYGLVREMISLQDAINKRGSKSLHLLNTRQVFYEDGAVDDINEFKRELAKPDGTPRVNPGAKSEQRVKVEAHLDLAASHFQMHQEAKNSIDLKGPNATMMGDKAQGSSAASGRAILASQQGGAIQLGDLTDHLRHLDKRVFRAIWNRIRQFWTEEKWIRVTDDERNVKWVGMNVDPAQVQASMQSNPEMAERIAGVVGNVAQLDCDIIIDEAPDNITPATEQWQGLVELAKGGVAIPPKVLIQAAPNLKNKSQLIDEMEKAAKEQPPDPEMQKLQAQLQFKQAELQLKAQEAQQGAQLEQQKAETGAQLEMQKAQLQAQIDQQKAQNDMQIAREKAMFEMQLKREIAEQDLALDRQQSADKMEIERTRAASGIQIEESRAESQTKLDVSKAKTQAQIAKQKAAQKSQSASA